MKKTIVVRLDPAEFELEVESLDDFFFTALISGKLMIRFDSVAWEFGEFDGLIGKRVEWRGEDSFGEGTKIMIKVDFYVLDK